jgi:hypothetical protein
VTLQISGAGDGEVQMHLHRDVIVGPRRWHQALDLLERQLTAAALVDQEDPVFIVRGAVGGRLIARPVPQSQQVQVQLPPEIRLTPITK